jgi:glycosyltransferase involved in cell wall biosynthesis
MQLSAGGPALSMYYTVRGLNQLGVNAKILADYTTDTDNLIGYDADITFWKTKPITPASYIPQLSKTLESIQLPDIYHIQGIWQYSYHQLIKFARSNNIPYILTPRGALYPEALAKSKYKKKLSRIVYQDRDLEDAACILVTCEDECRHIRNLGFTSPVAIIPNPIDVSSFVDYQVPIKEKRKIGYLGRLHPRKHVDRLIHAFANLSVLKDAELVIMGKGDDEYEQYLKKEVTRLNLSNVTFTGFVKGDQKDKAIKELSLIALPSDFENFGNVISEALVRGVPVLTTHGAPWSIVEKEGCGWWIDNKQEAIEKALSQFMALTPQEIQSMGDKGRKLVSKYFSVESVAKKNKELYEWILGGIQQPDFINKL